MACNYRLMDKGLEGIQTINKFFDELSNAERSRIYLLVKNIFLYIY